MKFGKELKYHNKWYRERFGDNSRSNVCSPLLFSCLFDNEFFIQRYLSDAGIKSDGISTNQENWLLREFFLTKTQVPFEQYNVFETNGKFNISSEVIKDIWMEHPQEKDYAEYGEAYLYMLNIVSPLGGFHKVALLQTIDKSLYFDSNQNTVLEYEHHELIEKFPYNKVNNISVMINPVTGEWMKFKISDFNHLIS